MSVSFAITVKALRAALADADIVDLNAEVSDREIDVDVDVPHGHSWFDEEEPQHDAYALDEFMSATVRGDRGTALALANRVFVEGDLAIVERSLARH